MARREGINYPRFKDQFAVMDFEAEPMPVLSLYPMPDVVPLERWELTLTGVGGERATLCWADLARLPRVAEKTPLVCQIFNWTEEPTVEGVRLAQVIEAAGLDSSDNAHWAFYSADGMYFEALPRSMALDPRVLLVFGLDGQPLPHQHGGPLRLWVPFLQGYKSVKWLQTVRAYRRDPLGIKRLLGQSRTAILGSEGQDRAGVVVARPAVGESPADI
ncbi:MAG TPA: molybdopterin-dependent oxidoreductase [Dehalococcoidia bacterium]|nr:molybdopterin-dependent oxidoreductase [Dehalococcoidia bacterium]